MIEQGTQATGPVKTRLVTMKETADILGISIRATYRLVADGQLPPPVKIGRASRMVLTELEEYIEYLKNQRDSTNGLNHCH